jgi:hypothetical protein
MDQFDTIDVGDEIEEALKVKELSIPSQRFEKEARKRIALRYLEGANQETQNEIIREIEER